MYSIANPQLTTSNAHFRPQLGALCCNFIPHFYLLLNHLIMNNLATFFRASAVLLCLCCFVGSLHAQIFRQELTLLNANSPVTNSNGAPSMVELPTGDVISVQGIKHNTFGTYGVGVVRYTATGSVVWSYDFGHWDVDVFPEGALLTSDNTGIMISATCDLWPQVAVEKNMFCMRIDLNGVLQWARIYGTQSNEENNYGIIEMVPNSKVFLLYGEAKRLANQHHVYCVAIDSSGFPVWSKYYRNNDPMFMQFGQRDRARAAVNDGNRVVLVAERQQSPWGPGMYDVLVLPIDYSGTLLGPGRSFANQDNDFQPDITCADAACSEYAISFGSHNQIWPNPSIVDHDAIMRIDNNFNIVWSKLFWLGTNLLNHPSNIHLNNMGRLTVSGNVRTSTQYLNTHFTLDPATGTLLTDRNWDLNEYELVSMMQHSNGSEWLKAVGDNQNWRVIATHAAANTSFDCSDDQVRHEYNYPTAFIDYPYSDHNYGNSEYIEMDEELMPGTISGCGNSGSFKLEATPGTVVPASNAVHIWADGADRIQWRTGSDAVAELVVLRDLSGRTLHQRAQAQPNGFMDVSGLAAGIYLVEVQAHGKRHHQKVMIR